MKYYIIIEDDKGTVNMLKEIVADNSPDIIFSGSASTINSGIELLKAKKPDFIFLDVNLEDGLSFDILKEFPNSNFKVIFITSFSKYAVEAFKFSALDFILKPFTNNDVLEAVKKVTIAYDNEVYNEKIEAFFHNFNTTNNKKLVLKNLDEIHIVDTDTIIYIKSDNNYSTFYLDNNSQIVISKTLKYYDEKLRGLNFFRAHQSYLINLSYLQSYDKKNEVLVLSNDEKLPVSQSRKPILLDFLNKLN